MSYLKCIKCGIILPIHYMSYIEVKINGVIRRVGVCPKCKQEIKNGQKRIH